MTNAVPLVLFEFKPQETGQIHQRPSTDRCYVRTAPDRPFTSREWEIILLLRRGKTTKEIADALVISADTVSVHRKAICHKLGVHSTAELVIRCSQL